MLCSDGRRGPFVASPAKEAAVRPYFLPLIFLRGTLVLPRILRVSAKTVNKDNTKQNRCLARPNIQVRAEPSDLLCYWLAAIIPARRKDGESQTLNWSASHD